MSTYVISDIHGCYDEYQSMLKKIKFSDTDLLIIAGDCIDRGNKNKQMMKRLMVRPDNIICIKGNHDLGFAQGIETIEAIMNKAQIDINTVSEMELLRCYNAIKEINGVFDYYGTIHYLIAVDHIGLWELVEWKNMINEMPCEMKICVEGREYVIVHAGYISEEDFEASSQMKEIFETREFFLLSAREEGIEAGGKPGSTIVAGHTPTMIEGTFFNNGKIWKKEDADKNCRYFDIDCGAAYAYHGSKGTKLACLRLEDEKEFYVKSGKRIFR